MEQELVEAGRKSKHAIRHLRNADHWVREKNHIHGLDLDRVLLCLLVHHIGLLDRDPNSRGRVCGLCRVCLTPWLSP